MGKSAYHALTFGWLMSGLARAVTGKGMRTLIREELAEPLGTDGIHLGRPPAEAPTRVAEIIMPQSIVGNPVVNYVTRKVAHQLSGAIPLHVLHGRDGGRPRCILRCWTPRSRQPTGW